MTIASRAPALLLQSLSIEANKAPDAKAAARAIVRLARDLLGSASSALWLLDGEQALELVASDGIPEAFLARWKRIPLTDDLPAATAVRRGEPVWIGTVEMFQDVYPRAAEHSRNANRPMAVAVLPLDFEQRILGAVTFGFQAPHTFTDDDKMLALAVAAQAAQALERARLQAAQTRALAGLRVIAKVGEMVTAASLDAEATLTALSRAVVPDVADWCAVDMIEDGVVRRLTTHHADPAKVERVRRYAERFPTSLDDPSIARVVRTAEAVWVRRIRPDMLDAAISNDEQLEFLHSLGLRSTVQVPLVSEGLVRGVVSFVMSESRREYDETDRDLLVEVGRRAGHALTNASLYAREQRARERVTRLAAVTGQLARASTTAEVGEVACREGATALGASWGALYELVADTMRLLASSNFGETLAIDYREVALDVDLPLTHVVRSGAPVVIESREQLKRDFPATCRTPDELLPLAFMCKPLADRAGTIVGALAFGFSEPRTFAVDERAFARTLADHCAQAFDRARILDLERTARERLALLAAAGDAFSTAIDYDSTLAAVVRTALPVLGDFAFFDVVETDGAVRRSSGAHDDPDSAAMLAASRWQKSERTDINLCALSTGACALHSNIDEAFRRDMAMNEDHLAALQKLQLCSMISVPVVLRGSVIGALTFCYGRSRRRHSKDDLELALELARRGAVAVDQARLYAAATAAAKRAEEANQLKDDFLATVSHELRTPLNAILGWAHLLDGDRLDDRAYVTRGLDVIRRNSHAQREIIEDILDVSRIISGKIRLEVVPIDIALVVKFAVEAVRPAAEAKTLELRTLGLDDPAPFVGDRGRLQQVVWNLLANAVKFTKRGGSVTVELLSNEDTITVRVTDDGMGIGADILPYVFDRFRQADSSTTRAHGGLGLGLSIVRHLVELHGGTAAARSDGPGRGAVFEVSFPALAAATGRETGSRAPAPQAPSTRPPPSLDGVHALLVDDAADSLEVVAALLQKAGATVRVAMNAGEAVELYERETFDVVVSDIAMPDIDGYALLGILQRKSSDLSRPLCAIALTAHGRPEDRANAMQAGFAAHVAKPINPPEVLATIARVLESPAVMTPAL